jgi:mono/diheme cytochrome c family protein
MMSRNVAGLRAPRRGVRTTVGTLLLLLLSGAATRADDLAVRGSAIAAEKCGRCHAVGVADASPHKITPPFRTLGADFPLPMLVEALRTGIVSGHEEMPQFDLGLDGVKALVAYIDSLNPNAPPYLGKPP